MLINAEMRKDGLMRRKRLRERVVKMVNGGNKCRSQTWWPTASFAYVHCDYSAKSRTFNDAGAGASWCLSISEKVNIRERRERLWRDSNYNCCCRVIVCPAGFKQKWRWQCGWGIFLGVAKKASLSLLFNNMKTIACCRKIVAILIRWSISDNASSKYSANRNSSLLLLPLTWLEYELWNVHP